MIWTRSRLRARLTIAVVIATTSLLVVSAGRTSTLQALPGDAAVGFEVENRDVYVIVGSTLRHPDATTSPNAPLFNVAGVSLDLTWGQWQRATSESTAHRIGGPASRRTDVRLQLRGLVPGGVYSVFYITLMPDSEHPGCPNVERSLPVPAFGPTRGPDASSFVADARGEARYSGRIEGDILGAQSVYFSVIYHFDGGTYHPFPNHGEQLTQGENCRGSFGEDAMRHILITQKGF
jgi:hypothetical protein